MKRWIVAAAVVLVLVGGGAALKRKLSKPADAGMRRIKVAAGEIEETVEATGSVVPLNRVEIKPPISGRIEKLLVEEGDTVKQGQLVAWMSSSDRMAILDAARAQSDEEFKRWQDAYKPTPIFASLPGVVILRNVVVGQAVDQGTVLYAVADRLVVVAQVDESDIGRVKNGMAARVTLDAYPDKPAEGRVFDILYEGKNVSNVITYGVKLAFDRVPPFFRSQMTANVAFIVNRKKDVPLLPLNAVRDLPGGVKQVMVPGEDGKPKPLEIKTGVENGEKVEIVDGLSAGDEVIVSARRYVPQQSAPSSPLNMGGNKKPDSSFGDAPRKRRGG